MSTKPRLTLEIFDGENALALLGQLFDIARGIEECDRVPFKVAVSREMHSPGGGRGSDRNRKYLMKAEIGLYVWAANLADPMNIEIRGKVDNDLSTCPQWVLRLITEHSHYTFFEGWYDANGRKGELTFHM